MKLRVELSSNIKKTEIQKIKKAIVSNEGILACEISSKGIINIVFDEFSLNKEDIIASIEDSGFIIATDI